MPDQPSPRRRFQFRLRTLMIGVTLLAVACGYVGWQAKIVRQRESERNWIQKHGGVMESNITRPGQPTYRPTVSWARGLLGDSGVAAIRFGKPISDDDERRIKSVFPEVDEVAVGLPVYPPGYIASPAP